MGRGFWGKAKPPSSVIFISVDLASANPVGDGPILQIALVRRSPAGQSSIGGDYKQWVSRLQNLINRTCCLRADAYVYVSDQL
jgi:hypothetical protein